MVTMHTSTRLEQPGTALIPQRNIPIQISIIWVREEELPVGTTVYNKYYAPSGNSRCSDRKDFFTFTSHCCYGNYLSPLYRRDLNCALFGMIVLRSWPTGTRNCSVTAEDGRLMERRSKLTMLYLLLFLWCLLLGIYI